MVRFETEMVITLPTPREEDYLMTLNEEVKKFTGKFSSKPYTPTVVYDGKAKKNRVLFQWNDAQFQADMEDEEKCKYLLGRMEYWFRHCKFFRKHQVSDIFSSYSIKG